ncbi:hypothetical protein [Vibrio phage nt-1]|uniref:Uncharacterized protein n=1 Tax=Vibrio phage nt-1 TaxID=115992 RepID=A0A068J954_9CAUD|nr:hypothetical protein VPFG_p15 [Vibrio phage nt-1]AIE13792.1 hypothetical protein [Vibrio phage nt-1]
MYSAPAKTTEMKVKQNKATHNSNTSAPFTVESNLSSMILSITYTIGTADMTTKIKASVAIKI